MLRKLRLTLAVLFFVAVTALFLDFTGTVHAWLGWTAKIQVPARAARPECRRDRRAGSADAAAGQGLLLGHLPAGRDAGHRVVDKRTAENKTVSLLLLARNKVAALRSAGTVRHRLDRRHRLVRGLAGAVQLLRAHRLQPFRPAVPLGQQSAGLFRRAGGQLRLL